MPGARTLLFDTCLGRGGFGEVYVAILRQPDAPPKRVAVKVLTAGRYDDDDAVRRLRDEGRVLRTLHHPGILAVDRICRVDGRVAMVMEYVEGIDLKRFTSPRRLPPPRVSIDVIGQVAAALDAAWRTHSPETRRPLQLVHRDVKPANIRLALSGSVKLLDFGLARSEELARRAKTQAGMVPFTSGYAAPETLEDGVQGHASDVFALGVTLHRTLTGQRVFGSLDVKQQIALAERQGAYEHLVRERLKDVRSDTRPLVQAMLAYEPRDRPTAREVHSACQDRLTGLTGPSIGTWITGVERPPQRLLEDAPLLGRELAEEPLGRDEVSHRWMPLGTPAQPDKSAPPVPDYLRGLRTATPAPPRRVTKPEEG